MRSRAVNVITKLRNVDWILILICKRHRYCAQGNTIVRYPITHIAYNGPVCKKNIIWTYKVNHIFRPHRRVKTSMYWRDLKILVAMWQESTLSVSSTTWPLAVKFPSAMLLLRVPLVSYFKWQTFDIPPDWNSIQGRDGVLIALVMGSRASGDYDHTRQYITSQNSIINHLDNWLSTIKCTNVNWTNADIIC